ncbi:hypothetical protein [Aquimarina rubra]|uniref:DUF4369 domain-containing protein n=1 Tax=Aquimarina rubra TaxID=1920033 RepID=A0ABW5LDS1_9FLAO
MKIILIFFYILLLLSSCNNSVTQKKYLIEGKVNALTKDKINVDHIYKLEVQYIGREDDNYVFFSNKQLGITDYIKAIVTSEIRSNFLSKNSSEINENKFENNIRLDISRRLAKDDFKISNFKMDSP